MERNGFAQGRASCAIHNIMVAPPRWNSGQNGVDTSCRSSRDGTGSYHDGFPISWVAFPVSALVTRPTLALLGRYPQALHSNCETVHCRSDSGPEGELCGGVDQLDHGGGHGGSGGDRMDVMVVFACRVLA